jgi:predicted ArsR family transcriptional regulator
MNKRDALFLKPDDFIDNRITIAAYGLYVKLTTLVQKLDSDGLLIMDKSPLTLDQIAQQMGLCKRNIRNEFFELINNGLIEKNESRCWILPIIRERMLLTKKRAHAGRLGNKAMIRVRAKRKKGVAA